MFTAPVKVIAWTSQARNPANIIGTVAMTLNLSSVRITGSSVEPESYANFVEVEFFAWREL